VAQVTLNRAKDKRYPNGVCEVVTQRKQFSWTIDKLSPVKQGKRVIGYRLKPQAIPKDDKSWSRSISVAKHVMSGKARDFAKGATFYHTKKVNPYWNREKHLVANLGNHLFYVNDKSQVNYNSNVNFKRYY
jgi:spore germination cell wall hydrolase CwlJ-like protein